MKRSRQIETMRENLGDKSKVVSIISQYFKAKTK